MFNVDREATEVSQDVAGVFKKTRNCEPKICLLYTSPSPRD